MTCPPRPPSPPDGPPCATYFSRRNASDPEPPVPAVTSITARSTNIAASLLTSGGLAAPAALAHAPPALARVLARRGRAQLGGVRERRLDLRGGRPRVQRAAQVRVELA